MVVAVSHLGDEGGVGLQAVTVGRPVLNSGFACFVKQVTCDIAQVQDGQALERLFPVDVGYEPNEGNADSTSVVILFKVPSPRCMTICPSILSSLGGRWGIWT